MDISKLVRRGLTRNSVSLRVRLAGVKQKRGFAQSLVEFALITPVMFTLFLGIIEFGWLFNNYILVNAAAREAARTGAVVGKNNTADESIKAVIAVSLKILPVHDPIEIKIYKAKLDGTVDCSGPSGLCYEDVYSYDGTTFTPIRLDWPPAGDYGRGILPRKDQEPTDAIAVEINYNHYFLINFVPGAIGSLYIRDHAIVNIEPAYFAPRQ